MRIYTAFVIAPLDSVDWSAFLQRPPLPQPSLEALDALADAPMLITGAGGSIGSALALRLASICKARAVFLDASENHLHGLQQAWTQVAASKPDRALFALGDAGDRAFLEDIFRTHRPRLAIHAAAYKHVPLLERQPFAAIANNVFATANVAAVAAEYGARVLLLSTDKAVQPASVMGATKRVAEAIVLGGGGTALRLANVLGSSGSAAEVFARQALRGGPMTVSDPKARRFFLTLDEAVDLLCAVAARNSSALLVPALADDYSVAELARFLARVFAPGREVSLCFTGSRPGDKLTERLWDEDEFAGAAEGGLRAIDIAGRKREDLNRPLAALRLAVRERDLTAALAEICALVPGFHPSQTVLALAAGRACQEVG